MAERRLESGFYGLWARSFAPFLHRPLYGDFAYIAAPRLAFGVNVHLLRNASRGNTDPRGMLMGSKMAVFPLGAGIVWIPGPVFCFRIAAAPSTAFSRIERPPRLV